MPKLKTSTFDTALPAITYTKVDQTWTVKAGVAAGSVDASAVVSTFNKSKLVNKGSVYSNQGAGVEFSGNKSKIVNEAGADITGVYGIISNTLFGSAIVDGFKVDNHGTVAGLIGVYAALAFNVAIENTGVIIGNTGIYYATPGEGSGPLIDNSGSIYGSGVAVLGALNPGQTATIVNHVGGTIAGGNAGAIQVQGGSLSLTNKGKIAGDVLAVDGTAADSVVNKGKIKGIVVLEGGNDVFKNKDKGKAGLIYGREGNDKFVLGSKTDKIVFDTELDAGTNIDRIRKFQSGEDRLYLDDDVFALASPPGTLEKFEFRKGTEAVDANDRIIYDKATGVLAYDADGVGGADAVQFAQFDEGQKLKYSDIMFGDFPFFL